MIFDTDSWQEILITLKKNKLRSLLTAFGVFWGILMLVIMLGAGNGLQNGVTDDFSRFAANAVYIWTRPTTVPYQGLPKGRRFYFKNDEGYAEHRDLAALQSIPPRQQLAGTEVISKVSRWIQRETFS